VRALCEIDPKRLHAVSEQFSIPRATVSFGELLRRTFNGERLIARLTAFYGLLALVLASVGLYGVASYTVARRTHEIGVRVALGARPWGVVRLVLRGALAPIALGLALGVPAALAAGRALAAVLVGVEPFDLRVFATAVAVLAACALVAAILPARRGSAVDPIQSLRAD